VVPGRLKGRPQTRCFDAAKRAIKHRYITVFRHCET
jgi:hypothetical protein